MPQVSKKYLKPWVEKRMWQVLEKTFSRSRGHLEVRELLRDVLTPTERIMLAKRLASAILLLKEYDYRQICHVLKVSSSTVLSVFKQLNIAGQGYRRAAAQIARDRQREEFFASLEKEIWKIFSGSRTVKGKIEAGYQKEKFFRQSRHL